MSGLDWTDRAALRAWLRGLSSSTEDLIVAAEDQTDAPSARKLGRAGAREMIDAASESLRAQLAFAERGLAVGEAWIRVEVTAHAALTGDGRRHVVFREPNGATHGPYVLPEDLDGDRLRVVVLGGGVEDESGLLTVLLPGVLPLCAKVRRADLLPPAPPPTSGAPKETG